MRKLTIFLCFLILSPAFISAQEEGQRGINPVQVTIEGNNFTLYSQSHALLIGVSDYNKALPALPGVEKDIENMKALFEKMDFNVVTVMNPTADEMLRVFSDFFAKYGLDPENRLLFYFGGQGYTAKLPNGQEMGYICSSDFPDMRKDPNNSQDKGISMLQIENYASQIQAKHAIFIFDACLSGSVFSLTDAVSAAVSYKTLGPMRQFIISGTATETQAGQSIFCNQLEKGLTGDADADKSGYVTGSELGEFLQTTVVKASSGHQHPQYGELKNTSLAKGDFVFIVVKPLRSLPSFAEPAVTKLPEEKAKPAAIVEEKKQPEQHAANPPPVIPPVSEKSQSNPPVSEKSQSNPPVSEKSQSNPPAYTTQARNQPAESKTSAQYGTLEIVSRIQGNLYVDGTFRKSMNQNSLATIDNLSEGMHTVQLRGKETIIRRVAIFAGQTHTVEIDKVSTPSSADNKPVGSGTVVPAGAQISTQTTNERRNATGSETEKPVVNEPVSKQPPTQVVSEPAPKQPVSNISDRQLATEAGMPEMIFVEGGSFQMGSNNGFSDEKPVHTVNLKNYFISKYEVTQKIWRDIMGFNPSVEKNCDDCPVNRVSWNDIQVFLQKLNARSGKVYQLPTEAQWECAARGGTKSRGYIYCGSNQPSDVSWFSYNSSKGSHPVGQKQPNELGLYDMGGNVWEWCYDIYDEKFYQASPADDPRGPSTSSAKMVYRVLRGGSWDEKENEIKATNRFRTFSSNKTDPRIGFRVVVGE